MGNTVKSAAARRIMAKSRAVRLYKAAAIEALKRSFKRACDAVSAVLEAKNGRKMQKSAEKCPSDGKNREKCQKSGVKTAKMVKKVPAEGVKAPKTPLDFGPSVEVAFRDGETGRVKCSASLEIADTPEKRRVGLSKRASLGSRNGMFFDCRGPFWMKDVEFPLDLVYTDRSGRITEKVAMPVDRTGSTLYPPMDFDSVNAVELPMGFCDLHGVSVGDVIAPK